VHLIGLYPLPQARVQAVLRAPVGRYSMEGNFLGLGNKGTLELQASSFSTVERAALARQMSRHFQLIVQVPSLLY
jgi:hypothetical protein